jgi:hypothetical protein
MKTSTLINASAIISAGIFFPLLFFDSYTSVGITPLKIWTIIACGWMFINPWLYFNKDRFA